MRQSEYHWARPQSWPLTVRVPLIAALLLIFVAAIASERVLSRFSSIQDENLRSVASVYLDSVSLALEPFILRQDIWGTFDTVDRARNAAGDLPVLALVATDNSNQIIAADDPVRFPTGTMAPSDLTAAPDIKDLSLKYTETTVWTQKDVVYQGQLIGHVVTEIDVDNYLAQRRNALWSLIIGNTLATMLLAGAGYLLISRMMRQVQVLSQFMGSYEGEGLEEIPPSAFPAKRTEFATLFDRYNKLVRAEEERRDIAQRLSDQAQLVSLGRLSSTLAHEINNPLGGMLNAVDTLRKFKNRPDVVETSAELLHRGLNNLRDVSRATLDFGRSSGQDHALSIVDFDDLRLLIEPELVRLNQTLDMKLTIKDDALRGLPSAKVRQIILNLLLNGSAAAGAGGAIGLEITDEGDTLKIDVNDSGPGLSETARLRLTVGTTSPGGAGVGLRSVREITQNLGGFISVADGSEGGAKITVRLPLWPNGSHKT